MTKYNFYIYRCCRLLAVVEWAVMSTPEEVAALLEGDYDADLVEWEVAL